MPVAPVRLVAASLAATLAVVAALSALAVTLAVFAFDLRIAGACALYVIVWWTSLFAVLPFGIRSQIEAGEVASGSEPGAPVAPALREKAIWTTIVAAVIFLAIAWLMPLAGL